MKGTVNVSGMTAAEIEKKFGVSRATAWRGVKSGHIHLNYHKAEMVPGTITEEEAENFFRIAKAIYYRRFHYMRDARNHKDDCIQQAMLRITELAGKSKDPNFCMSVALYAMKSYLQKMGVFRKNFFERQPIVEEAGEKVA